ncbi:MAG: tRNA threonylcarbamoyladenosine dehydratase [Sphingobacteriales bacterium]|uniref:tRNA threonylcarbamoyladenosine dehydratase n=1 Tax=Hydrotalea flava TaxID=714549 RepID=UPI00082C4FDD|nr:tRNA threonylcarbamoyladenosine dehydratase [Hydrotalea flava]RTL56651.1 MAG: tRNA threonylcarbamoyladenosine dehydratase [Sphingobacteriales bacterium]
MIPYWMSRTNLLLHENAIETLQSKKILLVGLGGVGGICAEMLVRAGIGHLTIVDNDKVDASNINRQLIALHSTVGAPKTDMWLQRLQDINPALQAEIVQVFADKQWIQEYIVPGKFDYVIDCIDTLTPKVFLLQHCHQHQIPIVSSMGVGGKINPSAVTICDIAETYECDLAKYVRKKLRRAKIYSGIKVVFSPEPVLPGSIQVTENAKPKKSIIGTISYMPAIFGCMLSSIVIKDILGVSTD